MNYHDPLWPQTVRRGKLKAALHIIGARALFVQRVITPERKARMKVQQKAWHAAHPEKAKEYEVRRRQKMAFNAEQKKAWRVEYRDRQREITKAWKVAHPEKVRESQRKRNEAYRLAHPEEVREKQRKYHEANRERLNARSKEYSKTHRAERNAYHRDRFESDDAYRERCRAASAEWRRKQKETNPEKYKATMRAKEIRNRVAKAEAKKRRHAANPEYYKNRRREQDAARQAKIRQALILADLMTKTLEQQPQ